MALACRPAHSDSVANLRADCELSYHADSGLHVGELPLVANTIPTARTVGRGAEYIFIRVDTDHIDFGERTAFDEVDDKALDALRYQAKHELEEDGGETTRRFLFAIAASRPAADVAKLFAVAREFEDFPPPLVTLRTPAPAWARAYPNPELAKRWADYYAADMWDSGQPPEYEPPRCQALTDTRRAVIEAPGPQRCDIETEGIAAAVKQCRGVNWDDELTITMINRRTKLVPELEYWVLAEGDPAAFGPPGATWGEVAEAWATRP